MWEACAVIEKPVRKRKPWQLVAAVAAALKWLDITACLELR